MTEPFPAAGRPTGPLDRRAWEDRWVRGDTPWDMADPAPPLVAAVRLGTLGHGSRVLVPGCGAGHDARFLASEGFGVTAVDVSPTALARAAGLAAAEGTPISFVEADLFHLPRLLGPFDVVWEHTCFCAIDPGRRDDYVRAVADALRPGGLLVGLFFDIRPETGPPFGTSEPEIRHRFGARFDVRTVRPAADSHPARAGRELYAEMVRR